MTGCGTCPEPAYLLQENGDRIELEDGSGWILLEDQDIGWILLEDQDIGCTSGPWKSKGSVFLLFMLADFVKGLIDG